MRMAVALLLLLAPPAAAQVVPDGDSRYRTIDYTAGGIFQLPTSPEMTQTILFAPGERIQSIILSDPSAYLVNVSGSGDSLSLKPNGRSAAAMMSVRTEFRSYEVELLAANAEAAPQVIRFSYAAAASEPQPPSPPPEPLADVSYRFSGSKELRPASIKDDGNKTFIAWRHDQAIPAIFALGPGGKEEMVDGYVRAGVFTIDRVYDELVFRIDRQFTTARRRVGRVRGER